MFQGKNGNEVTRYNSLSITQMLVTKHNIKEKQIHRRWQAWLCTGRVNC